MGSAGAIDPSLKMRDLVIAMGACTNSNYAAQYELPGTYAPIASYSLVEKAVNAAVPGTCRSRWATCCPATSFTTSPLLS